jgi:hypothetical protein
MSELKKNPYVGSDTSPDSQKWEEYREKSEYMLDMFLADLVEE